MKQDMYSSRSDDLLDVIHGHWPYPTMMKSHFYLLISISRCYRGRTIYRLDILEILLFIKMEYLKQLFYRNRTVSVGKVVQELNTIWGSFNHLTFFFFSQ